VTRSIRPVALLVAVLMLLVAATACGGDDAALDVDEAGTQPADYSYVIPVGAGEALDRGEPLEILPAELEVKQGEVIEIRNEDDRGHTVGPFFVGGNETLRQQFTSPGEYIGICTVHPSGEIVLTVV
jgi:plastocyanin